MDWREYLKLLTKRNTDELKLAYESLLKILPEVERKIKILFDVKDYNIVIYVGLENGAGSITKFMGGPQFFSALKLLQSLNVMTSLRS